MTNIDAAQLELLKSALLRERASILGTATALEADKSVLVASQRSGEDRPRDLGDGDSLSVELELLAQISTAQTAAFDEVNDALARIDAGTYGVCTGCRGDIPLARLEFRPRTATCVPCASRRR